MPHSIKLDKQIYTDDSETIVQHYNDIRLLLLAEKCQQNNLDKIGIA